MTAAGKADTSSVGMIPAKQNTFLYMHEDIQRVQESSIRTRKSKSFYIN